MIWGFSSPSGLDTMKNSESFFADGTFKMVQQTMFSHIWVIVCSVGLISVPVAWFCLPNKEYTTYKIVLTCLKDRNIMAPKEFHVDYEAATIKAIKDVFPDSSILGCSVHFKRCIKKHLQTKGLLQLYNTDPEVQTFVRYVWAISLVPPRKVIEVWENFVLENQLEADEDTEEAAVVFNLAMDSFVKYVEGT